MAVTEMAATEAASAAAPPAAEPTVTPAVEPGDGAVPAGPPDQQGSLPIEPAPSAEALLAQWYQRYPQAFFKGHTRPLKVGIHLDLAADEPWPEKLVRRALAGYVNLPRYLKAVREGAERIDLAGRPQGRVDAQAAEHAQRKLERLQAVRRRNSPAGGRKRRGAKNAKPGGEAVSAVQPETQQGVRQPEGRKAAPVKRSTPPATPARPDAESVPASPPADSANPEARLEAKLSALLAKHGGDKQQR
ncbi:ABC transporter substrate-binding protein [Halomonas campisalis]|uniref:ABC transporter substrate-binding protein n=2 Tax=Billgrantia campisalis TaxID=74661 RepID=A0ABS9PAG5_9GAMM|nr:ABC transporter substrate-binding protein [Halomonas campisalis]